MTLYIEYVILDNMVVDYYILRLINKHGPYDSIQ